MLPDLIPSKVLSRGTVGQRHKALWKQASFAPIPSGTPVIPQGMYILLIGATTNIIISFFQMITQMLAHSLRKAHIKILLIFYFKVLKAAAKRQGVVLAG